MNLLEYIKDPINGFVLVLSGILVLGLWLLYGRQPKRSIDSASQTKRKKSRSAWLCDESDDNMY